MGFFNYKPSSSQKPSLSQNSAPKSAPKPLEKPKTNFEKLMPLGVSAFNPKGFVNMVKKDPNQELYNDSSQYNKLNSNMRGKESQELMRIYGSARARLGLGSNLNKAGVEKIKAQLTYGNQGLLRQELKGMNFQDKKNLKNFIDTLLKP